MLKQRESGSGMRGQEPQAQAIATLRAAHDPDEGIGYGYRTLARNSRRPNGKLLRNHNFEVHPKNYAKKAPPSGAGLKNEALFRVRGAVVLRYHRRCLVKESPLGDLGTNILAGHDRMKVRKNFSPLREKEWFMSQSWRSKKSTPKTAGVDAALAVTEPEELVQKDRSPLITRRSKRPYG